MEFQEQQFKMGLDYPYQLQGFQGSSCNIHSLIFSVKRLFRTSEECHFMLQKYTQFGLFTMKVGMREGEVPLPLAFQYLICTTKGTCDLNLAVISSLASECQHFTVGMPVFQPFYLMKLKTSKFKVLAF